MNEKQLQVMLVDDHELVRGALVIALSLHEDIQVVGEAGDGQEAVQRFQQLLPDVILMDLVMPKVDGVEAVRQIRRLDPEVLIIALTSYEEQELVLAALQAGVNGYILKTTPSDELATLIRRACRGEKLLSPEVIEALRRANSS